MLGTLACPHLVDDDHVRHLVPAAAQARLPRPQPQVVRLVLLRPRQLLRTAEYHGRCVSQGFRFWGFSTLDPSPKTVAVSARHRSYHRRRALVALRMP